MRASSAAALVLALAAPALAAGCGGEREFGAAEFVDAANGKGAALALGGQVTTTASGEPVYAVRSESGSDPNPQLEEGHGGGTMIVAADAGVAADEFERCESAADLTCFRAANIVLRFEEMAAADRARISGAVSALASAG
ncbi:MAG: hypothetical protein R2718_01905 [Solirubrobacterales bacterium]